MTTTPPSPPRRREARRSFEPTSPIIAVEVGGIRYTWDRPTLAEVLEYERVTGIEYNSPQAWFSRLGLAGYLYMAKRRDVLPGQTPQSWSEFEAWYRPDDTTVIVDEPDDDAEDDDVDPPSEAEEALAVVGD